MLTASDVVASHRDAMIWHAITRARERHGLHLTVSDIERLNAQYRTNKLTAVTNSSYETDTKKLHGYTRRILCWSLEYECYVAYDDTARTVTTFLPKGFDPDSPGQGSSVEAGPQRAKPLPLPPWVSTGPSKPKPRPIKTSPKIINTPPPLPSEEDGGWMAYAINYRARELGIGVASEQREAKYLMGLIREAIVEWYCNKTGVAEFTFTVSPASPCRTVKLPDGSILKPRAFYYTHRSAIWYAIRDHLGEPHDWIGCAKQYIASRGWTINRGGWVRRNDGVLICHGYQQLIRNVHSNPGGEF